MLAYGVDRVFDSNQRFLNYFHISGNKSRFVGISSDIKL